MGKFIEYYEYEKCSFVITKENSLYWARFDEMSISDEDLNSLKKNQIPICYYQHRKFNPSKVLED
ncbi:hypothetical protein [Clostridium perfringens]|uniref:hypothetical protein n=1 Tax=Clostridium perfringens TaxID=1502 RepID=UPI00096AC6C4|nr:hypothetical protein [Clostridium perfringens]EHR9037964.1 hypothetical protein [Clostridium perfringens]EIW6613694.1 hypothetical protein [Clostridium perfringens]MDM0556547.1 hypothetical protein [Clostridium perfringens]CAJ1611461.1 hypothetical protein CLO5623_02951 [Clostridium perfringens]